MKKLFYTMIDGSSIELINELKDIRYGFNDSTDCLIELRDELDKDLFNTELLNRFRICASNIANSTNYISKDRIVIFDEIVDLLKNNFNITNY